MIRVTFVKTEDRPYRKGMNPESTTAVLQVMVDAEELKTW